MYILTHRCCKSAVEARVSSVETSKRGRSSRRLDYEMELKRRRLKTLGAVIEDDDLILHILNCLPREYETVVELCQEDLF